MATSTAQATLLVAIDDHGSVLAFASDSDDQALSLVRGSADETARTQQRAVSVVRIGVPLPPGVADASVVVIDRVEASTDS